MVRDQHIANIVLRLQILQQVHYLRPDRNIQRRHRFVQHNHFRVERQSAGDRQPLPLPAAEFVRV